MPLVIATPLAWFTLVAAAPDAPFRIAKLERYTPLGRPGRRNGLVPPRIAHGRFRLRTTFSHMEVRSRVYRHVPIVVSWQYLQMRDKFP